MILIKDNIVDQKEINLYMDLIENDKKFNTYTLDKSISDNITEIQTVPWFGVLIIYSDVNIIDKNYLMYYLSQRNVNSQDEEDINYTTSYLYNDLLPFGNMKTKAVKKSRSVKIIDNYTTFDRQLNRIIKRNLYQNDQFLWIVKIITKEQSPDFVDYGCLLYPVIDKIYLLSSVSTIIYDTCDLFKCSIKQIDFPYLHQYNYNNILETPLYIIKEDISQVNRYNNYGIKINLIYDLIAFNINYHFVSINLKKMDNKFILYEHEIYLVAEAYIYNPNIENINITNPNENKYLEHQRCFISNAPLYGRFYEFEILYNNKGEDIREKIFINQTMICVYNINGYENGISIDNCISNIKYKGVFLTVSKAVESIFKIKYSVKNATVKLIKSYFINNFRSIIYNLNEHINYKNLLLAILDNGLFCNSFCSNKYAVNITSNQIFIGYKKIADIDIMLKKNSSTILFMVKNYWHR